MKAELTELLTDEMWGKRKSKITQKFLFYSFIHSLLSERKERRKEERERETLIGWLKDVSVMRNNETVVVSVESKN